MKKIHLLESQKILLEGNNEYQAGTDHPYYRNEKTGEEYEAVWDCDFGYPFGYWPIEYNGSPVFSIGEAYSTHLSPFGQCVKEYVESCLYDIYKENSYYFIEEVENLLEDFKTYGHTYDEDQGLYVSEDGTDSIDIDEWVDDNCNSIPRNIAREVVENALDGNGLIDNQTLTDRCLQTTIEDTDFDTKESINYALGDVGTNFDSFFAEGRFMGRVWPHLEMIGFYENQQPSPEEFEDILNDLENANVATVDELYGYTIIFRSPQDYNVVTACTVSDYIDGNYGEDDDEDDDYEEDDEDDDYEDEDDYEEPEYTKGTAKFIPHLANQERKREFYKNFRDTRDKAVYTPREKAAGNLARYHAMRYPYGESIERNKKRNI